MGYGGERRCCGRYGEGGGDIGEIGERGWLYDRGYDGDCGVYGVLDGKKMGVCVGERVMGGMGWVD